MSYYYRTGYYYGRRDRYRRNDSSSDEEDSNKRWNLASKHYIRKQQRSWNTRVKELDRQRRKVISFCVTCMNRFQQLKETLPRNLKNNYKLRHWVEFVLVNFVVDEEESQQIHHWVRKQFSEEIKTGFLRYKTCSQLTSWHASIAKNTSHRIATGQFLVNLDCDNYLECKETKYLLSHHLEDKIYHGHSGRWRDGTYGRIGVSKKLFLEIGGYDESFGPMGCQDIDLFKRLEAQYRYPVIKPMMMPVAIQNSKMESLKNTQVEGKSVKDFENKWTKMEWANRKKMKKKLQSKKYIREGRVGVPTDEEVSDNWDVAPPGSSDQTRANNLYPPTEPGSKVVPLPKASDLATSIAL